MNNISKKLTISGFFIAVFIVGLDSFIISPLLPTIAKSLGSTNAKIGLGVTTYAIFYAIGAPIIAPFSERLPRKMMISLGLLIFTVSTFLCGFSFNVHYFYAYRSFAGLGAAMFTPNVYAYIGSNFNKDYVGKVMGIVMSALSLSIAVGVPIGSFIASILNWRWTFFCSGFFSFISLVLIVLFVERDNLNNVVLVGNPFKHYLNIIKSKDAVLGLLMIFFWMYGFYAVYTYLGMYIADNFYLSTTGIGLVFVAYGLSNFISSFSGGWIGNIFGMKKVILMAGVVSIFSYLILGIDNKILIIFILFLAILAFAQGIGTPQLTTFNATILPESRATMTSLNSSFLYLGLTVGSSLGSFLVSEYSFLVLAISSVISTFIAVLISQIIVEK